MVHRFNVILWEDLYKKGPRKSVREERGSGSMVKDFKGKTDLLLLMYWVTFFM